MKLSPAPVVLAGSVKPFPKPKIVKCRRPLLPPHFRFCLQASLDKCMLVPARCCPTILISCLKDLGTSCSGHPKLFSTLPHGTSLCSQAIACLQLYQKESDQPCDFFLPCYSLPGLSQLYFTCLFQARASTFSPNTAGASSCHSCHLPLLWKQADEPRRRFMNEGVDLLCF